MRNPGEGGGGRRPGDPPLPPAVLCAQSLAFWRRVGVGLRHVDLLHTVLEPCSGGYRYRVPGTVECSVAGSGFKLKMLFSTYNKNLTVWPDKPHSGLSSVPYRTVLCRVADPDPH
jgi:hypothetical protein